MDKNRDNHDNYSSQNYPHYGYEGIAYNVDDLRDEGIYLTEVRRGRFSPIMRTQEQLYDTAVEIAALIEDYHRTPLTFEEFIKEMPTKFIPDCDYYKGTLLIDTGTYSKQSGNMPADIANEVINTKLHCTECPLVNQCLAISMTGIQITRVSRTERTLPKYPGDTTSPTLVMDDFLIFGGLTPQERRIVFHHVCDILEENNMLLEESGYVYHQP